MNMTAEAAGDPAVEMTKDGISVKITTENAPADSLLYSHPMPKTDRC